MISSRNDFKGRPSPAGRFEARIVGRAAPGRLVDLLGDGEGKDGKTARGDLERRVAALQAPELQTPQINVGEKPELDQKQKRLHQILALAGQGVASLGAMINSPVGVAVGTGMATGHADQIDQMLREHAEGVNTYWDAFNRRAELREAIANQQARLDSDVARWRAEQGRQILRDADVDRRHGEGQKMAREQRELDRQAAAARIELNHKLAGLREAAKFEREKPYKDVRAAYSRALTDIRNRTPQARRGMARALEEYGNLTTQLRTDFAATEARIEAAGYHAEPAELQHRNWLRRQIHAAERARIDLLSRMNDAELSDPGEGGAGDPPPDPPPDELDEVFDELQQLYDELFSGY